MAYIIDFNDTQVYAKFLKSGNSGSVTPDPEYTYELTELEEDLHDYAISRLNQVNPNHKYMSFAFITDLHSGNTINPDGGYYNHTAEQSLKLLGAIANSSKMDAVLVGGDLSSGKLSFDDYESRMDLVKSWFEKYIPCAYFITDGNHDRKYNGNVRYRTNEEWLARLQSFNNYRGNSVTFAKDVNLRDINNVRVTENPFSLTYWVDFDEYKVRLTSISSYEKEAVVSGGASAQWYRSGIIASMMFTDNKRADEWFYGAFTHCDGTHDMNGRTSIYSKWLTGTSVGQKEGRTYGLLNNGIRGKGFLCELSGHWHQVQRNVITSSNIDFQRIEYDHSFTAKDPSEFNLSSYNFTIFVVDTDQMKLYEIEVGRHQNETTTGIREYNISRYNN